MSDRIYIMIGDTADISYIVLGYFSEDEKTLLFNSEFSSNFLRSFHVKSSKYCKTCLMH